MANAIAKPNQQPSNINMMKPTDIAKTPAMVRRFEAVLGKAAPSFLAGIVAATSTNATLSDPKRTDQTSLFAAGLVGATLNLSFVPSLGQAALVPFRENKGEIGKVQFQVMVRGLIQLAQRSGQYRNINAGEVYADEFEGEDLLTGEVKFHRVEGGFRDQGKDDQIVGYFAYIETNTGFRKTEYWTKAVVENHARKFSKSYTKGPWRDNFNAMAKKTVLKSLLNHYGPMSVDSLIADAIAKDQMVFDAKGNGSFEDNPQNDPLAGAFDAEYQEENQEAPSAEPAPEPTPAPAPQKPAKAQKPQQKAAPAPQKPVQPEPEPQYDEPMMGGPEGFDDMYEDL